MELIAYLRVSTDEQGDSRLGLAAQEDAIAKYVGAHDHTIVHWAQDVASAKAMKNRPGLGHALEILAAGEAHGLVVAKLDRLSRSVPDFGNLLEAARKQCWSFVAIDLGVDTNTASGELVAGVMMQIAQWERRIIGERTSQALQAKKRQGYRLGRPVATPPAVTARVQRWRSRGWTWRKIADRLNAEGVPTSQGGTCWRVNTARGLVKSAQLDAEAAKVQRARRAS